jgi:hypothetical protein
MWRSEVVSSPGGSVLGHGLDLSTQQPSGTLRQYTAMSTNEDTPYNKKIIIFFSSFFVGRELRQV